MVTVIDKTAMETQLSANTSHTKNISKFTINDILQQHKKIVSDTEEDAQLNSGESVSINQTMRLVVI